MLDVSRQQQLTDHVEDQQRLHAVERDAVPQLRARQYPEGSGVAEELGGRGYGTPPRHRSRLVMDGDCRRWRPPGKRAAPAPFDTVADLRRPGGLAAKMFPNA